ncbi:MAG: hypothetical protein EXR46_06010 [Dehalococcoidia bacterium]|nr:hypothetical protein [Dehalococcoidia bacterium]
MTLLRRITGVLLLAACAVSEEEAQRIVDRSIAQTVTAMPTATPAPAATPLPTLAPLSPTVTTAPSPTPVLPRPTATPRIVTIPVPVAASSQTIQLGDGLILVMDSAQPATGLPVRCQISGLPPGSDLR